MILLDRIHPAVLSEIQLRHLQLISQKQICLFHGYMFLSDKNIMYYTLHFCLLFTYCIKWPDDRRVLTETRSC